MAVTASDMAIPFDGHFGVDMAIPFDGHFGVDMLGIGFRADVWPGAGRWTRSSAGSCDTKLVLSGCIVRVNARRWDGG